VNDNNELYWGHWFDGAVQSDGEREYEVIFDKELLVDHYNISISSPIGGIAYCTDQNRRGFRMKCGSEGIFQWQVHFCLSQREYEMVNRQRKLEGFLSWK